MKVKRLVDVSIIIYAIKYFLDMSSIESFKFSIFSDILLYVALFLCVAYLMLEFISRRYKTTMSSMILVITFVSAIFLIRSNMSYTIYVMFFIYLICGKFRNPQSMITTIVYSSAFILGILALLAIVGIIPNLESSQGEYSLGLATQETAWYFFNICAGFIYIKREQIKKNMFIILFIINILLYLLTRTRLSAILVFAFLTSVYIYWKKSIMLNKLLLGLSRPVFIIFCGFTYFITLNYAKLQTFNTLLVGRPMFGMRVLANEGISLFPRNITYQSTTVDGRRFIYYVDMGYLDVFIRFGIIVAIILLLTYTYLINKAINEMQFVLIYWLLGVSVFNVVNFSFLNLFFDCSLLLIWEHVPTMKRKKLYDNNEKTRANLYE